MTDTTTTPATAPPVTATPPSLDTILADIQKIVTAANTIAPNMPLLQAAPDALKNLQAAAPDLATAATTLQNLAQLLIQLFQLLVALGVKLPVLP